MGARSRTTVDLGVVCSPSPSSNISHDYNEFSSCFPVVLALYLLTFENSIRNKISIKLHLETDKQNREANQMYTTFMAADKRSQFVSKSLSLFNERSSCNVHSSLA